MSAGGEHKAGLAYGRTDHVGSAQKIIRIIRDKPARLKKLNGSTPPAPEKCAVIRSGSGETIKVFDGMGQAMLFATKNGGPGKLEIKKIEPAARKRAGGAATARRYALRRRDARS